MPSGRACSCRSQAFGVAIASPTIWFARRCTTNCHPAAGAVSTDGSRRSSRSCTRPRSTPIAPNSPSTSSRRPSFAGSSRTTRSDEGFGPKAVAYARRAGDDATMSLAYEEAARLYRMALAVLDLDERPDDETRVEVLLVLGDDLSRAGDLDAARAAFLDAAAIARRTGNGARLARAALGFGGRHRWARTGRDTRLIPLLQDALVMLGGGDDRLRVQLLTRLACAWRSSPERRDDSSGLSRQAVEIARRLDDPATVSDALIGRFWATWWPDNPDERDAIAAEVRSIADALEDGERSAGSHLLTFLTRMERGRLAEARQEMAALARAIEDLRQPAHLWLDWTNRALLALVTGDLADAEEYIVRELETEYQVTFIRDEISSARTHRFLLRREQGRSAEEKSTVRASVDEYPWYPFHRAALGCLLLDLGRDGEARVPVRRAGQGRFRGAVPRTTSGSWAWASPARPARSLAMLRRPRRCTNSYARTPVGSRSGSLTGASAPLIVTWGCLRPRVAGSTTLSATSRRRSRSTRAWGPGPLRPTAGTTWPKHCDSATRREIAAAPISSTGRRGLRQRSSGWRSPARIGAADAAAARRADPLCRWARRRSAARANTGRSSSGARPSGFGTPRGCATSPGCSVHRGERSTPSSSLSSSHRQRAFAPARGELPFDGFGDAGPVLDDASKAAYRERLEDLRTELSEAEDWNDTERAARLRDEQSALGSRAGGGRGNRRSGPPRRLRGGAGPAQRHEGDPTALARVAAQSQPLGAHFDATIRTGTFCSYVRTRVPRSRGVCDDGDDPRSTVGRWWRWGRVELPVQNPSPETTTSVSDGLSSTARTGIGTLPDGPVTCP